MVCKSCCIIFIGYIIFVCGCGNADSSHNPSKAIEGLTFQESFDNNDAITNENKLTIPYDDGVIKVLKTFPGKAGEVKAFAGELNVNDRNKFVVGTFNNVNEIIDLGIFNENLWIDIETSAELFVKRIDDEIRMIGCVYDNDSDEPLHKRTMIFGIVLTNGSVSRELESRTIEMYPNNANIDSRIGGTTKVSSGKVQNIHFITFTSGGRADEVFGPDILALMQEKTKIVSVNNPSGGVAHLDLNSSRSVYEYLLKYHNSIRELDATSLKKFYANYVNFYNFGPTSREEVILQEETERQNSLVLGVFIEPTSITINQSNSGTLVTYSAILITRSYKSHRVVATDAKVEVKLSKERIIAIDYLSKKVTALDDLNM